MDIFADWRQTQLVFGVLVLLSLGGLLWLLSRLSAAQRELSLRREAELQHLARLLREQERASLRELGDIRQALGEQLARGYQAQQRATHQLQQQLLLRIAKLYQALERRFGEMQQHLTEDAGRLRQDLLESFDTLKKTAGEALSEGRLSQQEKLSELRETVQQYLNRHRQAFDERQLDAMRIQQEGLQAGMEEVRKQVREALTQHASDLGKRVEVLTESTDRRLQEISGQVEKRLSEGFEKTTETFNKVLVHLTRIDEAQKKITELSSNVVSLQEILTDKRSRGAFGEVQLAGLVRNLMPEGSFGLQISLSNGTRVDCLLYLPEPTGNVPIDAKFPLESFQRMMDDCLSEMQRAQAARQFRQDIRKHIGDIASKYLISGETSDGAVMFLPAEAVFAEIHAHFPDLVEEAQRERVWLVSPTTLMAILTTARAVLKDEATRKQVHIIQDHLRELAKDFGRFQQRMESLSKHIAQAHKDAEQVNVSARKISGRFAKIERVELEDDAAEEGIQQQPVPAALPAAEE